MFSNNPLSPRWRSRIRNRNRKEHKGTFPYVQKAYADHKHAVIRAGHEFNEIVWKWLRDYDFNYAQGFTLMLQHTYLDELREHNFQNVVWDDDISDDTDDFPIRGGKDYVFLGDEEDFEKQISLLGLDAPLLLMVAHNVDFPPSDMTSILEEMPESNRMKKYQKKLFGDDPDADIKMELVLRNLNIELHRILAKKGFELGDRLHATIKIDRGGYKATYYQAYPIYLQGTKPLIPWPTQLSY